MGFVNIAPKLSHFDRKQMPSVFIIINVQSYWNKTLIFGTANASSVPGWGCRGRKMNLSSLNEE